MACKLCQRIGLAILVIACPLLASPPASQPTTTPAPLMPEVALRVYVSQTSMTLKVPMRCLIESDIPEAIRGAPLIVKTAGPDTLNRYLLVPAERKGFNELVLLVEQIKTSQEVGGMGHFPSYDTVDIAADETHAVFHGIIGKENVNPGTIRISALLLKDGVILAQSANSIEMTVAPLDER